MTESVIFKFILLGNGSVGKTSIKHQWVGRGFKAQYLMTLGADFDIKVVTLDNKTTARIQLWDIAGQTRFVSIRQMYYVGSSGIILVYDVTNEQSFKDLSSWLKQCREYAPQAKIIIVGNKKDLIHDRIISIEDGKKFAFDNNALFNETSALTGEGINETFNQLITAIAKSKVKLEEKPTDTNIDNSKFVTASEQITTIDPDLLFESNEIIYELTEKM